MPLAGVQHVQVDAGGGLLRPLPLGGILNTSNSKLTSQSLRGQLAWQQSWGSTFNIHAIAGAEIREVHNKANSASVYGYTDDGLTSTAVDYTIASIVGAGPWAIGLFILLINLISEDYK